MRVTNVGQKLITNHTTDCQVRIALEKKEKKYQIIPPGANSRVTDFARSTGQQCFTSVHCLQICSTAKFCAVVIIAKLMRLIYVFFDQRLNLFMLYIVNCL